MIAEAMDKVSTDGVITVEESKSLATELEITEGMAFDRGYSSPYFVTDADRQVCEFENPLILLTDRKISTITDLVPVCLLYTSPSPRDKRQSRMPSSA